MNALASTLFLVGWSTIASAATTINEVNKFGHGANVGWLNVESDVANGAVIGEFVCSGYIWGANAGWIRLGDGAPANGIRYQNNSATDFGVNHDGLGNLRGYAYGANIGWLTFTNRDASGALYDGPKVDLITGALTGFIWSANGGWISLSNAQAFVQTDTINSGADRDRDGIPDAWELLNFGDLATANAGSDKDGDGFSDLGEQVADTDPNDPASSLRITAFTASPGGSLGAITWTSVATRRYRVLESDDVVAPAPWIDVGSGLISPAAGDTTTRRFTFAPSRLRFFRIEAVKPLSL